VELCGSKKNTVWLWWAIDRATRSVLGWALGDRDTRAAQALGAQVPCGDHIRYYTDYWQSYCAIFPAERHTRGKAHTHHIESMNNKLRNYLARLRRKTHCYSKSIINLRDSLLFIFQRKFGCKLQPAQGAVICERLWGEVISIPV